MNSSEEEINLLFKTWTNVSDERTFLLKLTTFWTLIYWILVMVSLTIGWIAKVFIYFYFYESKLTETPINLLILIEQIVHHFCGNFVLLNFSLSLSFGMSVGEMIDKYLPEFFGGRSYCWVFASLQLLILVYRSVNGFMIALVRTIYIRKGSWVKYRIGEKSFLVLPGLITVFISSILVYLYLLENVSSRSLFNVCNGHTQLLEVFFQTSLNISRF